MLRNRDLPVSFLVMFMFPEVHPAEVLAQLSGVGNTRIVSYSHLDHNSTRGSRPCDIRGPVQASGSICRPPSPSPLSPSRSSRQQMLSLVIPALVLVTPRSGYRWCAAPGHRFSGQWALPGGPTQWDETLADTALRSLHAATQRTPGYLEQLYSFGGVERSAEAQRLVTIAYWALYGEHELEPEVSVRGAHGVSPVQVPSRPAPLGRPDTRIRAHR